MTEPLDAFVSEGLSAVRLRLLVAYDGTDFCGWARQPGLRSVQGMLEEAIVTALRLDSIRAVCAGRTDAGVHARGQVVHVDVPVSSWDVVAPVALRRLNGLLAADVRVLSVEPAAPGFDARWSALRRHYRYQVSDGVGDPLRRTTCAHHVDPLDIDRMNVASQWLLGEHDFASFCREREGTSSVRTLQRFDWVRDDDGVVTAHVTADAFCHSMVRSLVGALLPVGDGRRAIDWPAQLLAARMRDAAVTVAPARGLVLQAVDYPDDASLAEQARLARRWRGAPQDNPITQGSA